MTQSEINFIDWFEILNWPWKKNSIRCKFLWSEKNKPIVLTSINLVKQIKNHFYFLPIPWRFPYCSNPTRCSRILWRNWVIYFDLMIIFGLSSSLGIALFLLGSKFQLGYHCVLSTKTGFELNTISKGAT